MFTNSRAKLATGIKQCRDTHDIKLVHHSAQHTISMNTNLYAVFACTYRLFIRALQTLFLSTILWHTVAHAGEPVHFTSAGLLSIEGNGYSTPPHSLDTTLLHGAWQTVRLPHTVSPQPIQSSRQDDKASPPTIVDWYRVEAPEPASVPRSLYIPRWKSDGQLTVYEGNRLIYQSHASRQWNGWNIPLLIPLDETANRPEIILLRVERPRMASSGISTLWLGEDNTLAWRYWLRNVLQVQLPFMSSAAFLAVGLFSLFVWFKQRSQLLYMLFFCVSLTAYLRNMHFYLGREPLPIPDDWFSWLTVNSLFWMTVIVLFFLNFLHRHPSRWLNRSVISLTLLTGIITLPPLAALPDIYILSPLIYVILLFTGTSVAITGLRRSLQYQSRDGVLLASWALLGMLFGLNDWLLQNNYINIEWGYLGSYTNVLAFLLFTYIMFYRYVGAITDVRHVNENLGIQLRIREAELTEIHRHLSEIQHKQILKDERQRLMQDMHDGMGSSLVSALRVVEHGHLGDHAVAEVLKGCIDDLKLAIDSMEPVEADLLLLLATLRFRLEPRLESSGIALRWKVNDVPELNWLSPKNSLHILRILQESFANIIKHTQATQISLATRVAGNFVEVAISDNGQGFVVEEALKKGGKGLSNQLRRAESIGSSVEWESNNAGTLMTLRLPIVLKIYGG